MDNIKNRRTIAHLTSDKHKLKKRHNSRVISYESELCR